VRTRGFAAAAATTLLVAAPAAGRALDHFTLADPVGDGTPDITQVTVGSNASGAITFVVQLGAKTALGDNEFVFVLVEADGNTATGMQPNGVDYLLQLDKSEAALFRWNGSSWQDTGSQSVYGYAYKGFRLSVNRSDLALNGNELRFWVEAQAGEQYDEAPDNRVETYVLSAQPLALRVTGFAAVAKTVKVGKPFAVGMQLHRSDLDELTSAGLVRCTAKVGKKAVKVRAAFPDDVALCAGTAPKSAKGKTLKVTLTFELDGVRVSRTASIRVR
jgi:hypothetical protein